MEAKGFYSKKLYILRTVQMNLDYVLTQLEGAIALEESAPDASDVEVFQELSAEIQACVDAVEGYAEATEAMCHMGEGERHG